MPYRPLILVILAGCATPPHSAGMSYAEFHEVPRKVWDSYAHPRGSAARDPERRAYWESYVAWLCPRVVAQDGTNKAGFRARDSYSCSRYMAMRQDRAESEGRQREHEAFLAGLANLKYGMSQDQVIDLLGRPTNVNESGGRWGTHDQWIYKRRGYLRPVYLYFQDGRFASWQK